MVSRTLLLLLSLREGVFFRRGLSPIRVNLPLAKDAPVNSRHYPFITILAATLLTVVPLCLVFLSTTGGSSAAVDAEVSQVPVADVAAEADPSSAVGFSPDESSPAMSPAAARMPPESRTPMVAAANTTRMNDVARDYSHGSAAHASLSGGSVSSPAAVTTTARSDFMSMESQSDPVFDNPLDEGLSTEPAPAALMGKPMPVTPFETPVRDDSSYYDATRHLALADRLSTADEPATVRPDRDGTASTATSPATSGETNRRPGSSSRRGRREKSASTPDPVVVAEDETLEDVVLQTPLESRRVDRVENVVGVTRATGYPIALVRSDLPDDDWWVQQMVGYQGNTFAARVNFGNEDSLSGSAYRMVIVFLDSPDEVRRFRIAKRFKELPKGTRHSREFFYVRR